MQPRQEGLKPGAFIPVANRSNIYMLPWGRQYAPHVKPIDSSRSTSDIFNVNIICIKKSGLNNDIVGKKASPGTCTKFEKLEKH